MDFVKELVLKIITHYIFDDIINIRIFDPNKFKKNEKSCKNILIYYMGYVAIKNLSYIKINRVRPLYLNINKINW